MKEKDSIVKEILREWGVGAFFTVPLLPLEILLYRSIKEGDATLGMISACALAFVILAISISVWIKTHEWACVGGCILLGSTFVVPIISIYCLMVWLWVTKIRGVSLLHWVSIIMLLIALIVDADEYYIVLRFVISAVCALLVIFLTMQDRQKWGINKKWIVGLIITFIIYNPAMLVRLSKELWCLLDIAVAIFMFYQGRDCKDNV